MKISRKILMIVGLFGITLSASLNVMANDMVLLPGGSFRMPALIDKTLKTVPAFYLDRHPVTNQEFQVFVKTHPEWSKSKIKSIFADRHYLSYWDEDFKIGDGNVPYSPVVRVSWYAARAFCEAQGKRLPTVDEWEYAGLIPFSDHKEIKSTILEWYGKAAEWPLREVMRREPNVKGIYDMHGLIWEWVDDFNSSMMTGESRADVTVNKNLFCGAAGSSAADPGDYAAFMRYAFRGSLQADYTVQNLGFRCAKDKELL